VISQDKVANAGKANEITHFRPLLDPLPLGGVVITDVMQTQREHARWLTEDNDAFHPLPPTRSNQDHGSNAPQRAQNPRRPLQPLAFRQTKHAPRL
jgi:hypothetical protein